MRRFFLILVMAGLFILPLWEATLAGGMNWEGIGREILNLQTVLVNPENPNVIYIGSDRGVFRTEDGGLEWKNILSVRGQQRQVNFLAFGPNDRDSLYAATAGGLFYSSNQGDSWSRIFKGKNSYEDECTALAVLPLGIYLGTRGGLFVSRDNGRSWHKEAAKLSKSHILAIAHNKKEPDYVYIACVDGLFKTRDSGQSWERIFTANPTEDGAEPEEETDDRDEEERTSKIRYICIDQYDLSCLYLATSRGVYKSTDRGLSWNLLPAYGLLNRDVKFLLISPDSILYAAAKSGIFAYKDEHWQELSLGLAAQGVSCLDLDKQGNLYAACEKGLFKANTKDFSFAGQDSLSLLSLYCKNEPEIEEVQQAAIQYAEVEPDKIKQWRRKAQIKAILPKLTVGFDRSDNTNYEIYTSATTRYVYEGPSDKSSGWDVALSWELGDLIWSSDQTSIDVRSRLMVELRDDILDEVNKLYFERIRVKMELNNLSIEERKKRLEKELRLKELTASLDALTGGYFSRQKKMVVN